MSVPPPIRNFVVVGGGTTGWIAAAGLARLLLRPQMAGNTITLIESAEIGTIGVGEATVPSVRDMLSFLNIDEADFILATDATYKLAIRFGNWRKENSDFWHPFGGMGPTVDNVPLYHLWTRERLQGGDAGPVSSLSIAAQLAAANKFAKPMQSSNSPLGDISFAYHFDAAKVGAYLRGYAETKGVKRIEGHIAKAVQGDDGMIDELVLKDGRRIAGDFFVDCSGFTGLLITALGSAYEDWSHWLTCDRALAVPCANTGPLSPYTLSTAHEAGWIWRIPLQSRTGNGIIYSSRMIDEDQAAQSLFAALDGKPLADPRPIRFTPGRRKEAWVKNCLSLGLASGFLEPLESTSIHLVFANLFRFFDHLPNIQHAETLRIAYNARCAREIEEIRDFLILHYCLSERRDSEFWRYAASMPLPASLESRLEAFRRHGKILADFYDLFRPTSWISLYDGMGIVPDACDPLTNTVPEAPARDILRQVRLAIRQTVAIAPTHEAFLTDLLKRPARTGPG